MTSYIGNRKATNADHVGISCSTRHVKNEKEHASYANKWPEGRGITMNDEKR
jgi:hypothetical protein